jgi:hypothetical protein
MFEKESDLRQQFENIMAENLSNVNADAAQKIWEDIQAFIQKNDYVTIDDFLKVMELLRQEDGYAYKQPESELLDDTTETAEDEITFDELTEELVPEELAQDKTQQEKLIHAIKTAHGNIMVTNDMLEACDNHLQQDLVKVFLHDINEIVHEARSKSLASCIGGLEIQGSHYIDQMIARAPHQVVKGTMKALYHHIGGSYQNIVLGSEIYPDEAGFGGAIKDELADKEMIHGKEPWQVKFGPSQ